MRILRAGAAALLVVGLAAGCSGGDDKKDDKTSKTASTDPDRLTPDDLPTPPVLKEAKGAVADVKVDGCPTKKGKNKVSGTVTNSTDAAADYVITISWITKRSDVVGRGVATVKAVAPGQSVDWSLTGSELAEGTYTCTTNVQRGALS